MTVINTSRLLTVGVTSSSIFRYLRLGGTLTKLTPMNEPTQPRSLIANADFLWTERGFVLTAELKQANGVFHVEWLMSGMSSTATLSVLAQLRSACPGSNEREATQYIQASCRIAFDFCLEMHKLGGSAALISQDGFSREQVLAAHLKAHMQNAEIFDSQSGINVRTLRQYEFCKSAGITKYVEYLAKFEEVPVSTIRRRIDKCRQLGWLTKRNERENFGELD